MRYYFILLLMFNKINVFCQKLNLQNIDSLTKQVLAYNWSNKEKAKQLIQNQIIADTTIELPKFGDSKIGGTPDMPISLKWPMYKDSGMVFLAQYNLYELSKYDLQNILPKTGFLYFFQFFPVPKEKDYGSNYDYNPSKLKYKVLYYDGKIEELQKTNYPKNIYDNYKLKPKKIMFKKTLQVVYDSSICYEETGLDSLDNIIYNQFYNDYEGTENKGLIKILGCVHPIQYDVSIDWLGSINNYVDGNYLPEFEFKKYYYDKKRRSSFSNLLELDLLHLPYEYIGESKIYIGIQKEDLDKRNFDNAVLIHQGT